MTFSFFSFHADFFLDSWIKSADLELPDHLCLARVRESLRNLRVFRLDIHTGPLEDEILSGLLQLMPNVTSLFLRWGSETMQSILCKPGKTFTNLALVSGVTALGCCDEILRKNAGSLRELDTPLPTEVSVAAVGDCTKLRHFRTRWSPFFKDSDLERLVLNNPDLESLDFGSIKSLTHKSLAHIKSVRKLSNLRLYQCSNLTSNGLCELGSLPKLQHLEVRESNFDIRGIRSLLPLTDLRTLILDVEVDSKSFTLICHNLKRLEVLKLDDCSKLTDEDGVKFRLLQHLSDLQMRKSSGFTDITFERGLGSPAMKSLFIDDTSMTDAGLVSVANHHGRLRYFTLQWSPSVTVAGLFAFMRRELYLKEVDFLTRAGDALPEFTANEHEWETAYPRLHRFNTRSLLGRQSRN